MQLLDLTVELVKFKQKYDTVTVPPPSSSKIDMDSVKDDDVCNNMEAFKILPEDDKDTVRWKYGEKNKIHSSICIQYLHNRSSKKII